MFRSCLFVPADRPDRFAKAAAAGADLVVLDLEDAVLPVAKDASRENIRSYLENGVGDARIGVRINAAGSEWFERDRSLLSSPRLAAVMLPKSETSEVLECLAARLGEGVALVPLVETALGIWNALDIARAPRVVQLAFGSVDFALDAGIGDDDRAMLYARSRLVLASAAAGIAPPLDGVTVDLDDPARIAADVAQARGLGFGGKLCIHPRQIAPVHDGLAPTQAELNHARAIVAAADAAGAAGAIRLDGKLIDRPVAERARRVLVGGGR